MPVRLDLVLDAERPKNRLALRFMPRTQNEDASVPMCCEELAVLVNHLMNLVGGRLLSAQLSLV